MKPVRKKSSSKNFGARLSLATFVLLSLGSAAAGSLPQCTTDSTQNPLTIIASAPCGTYGIITTRKKEIGGDEVDVKVQYMVHAPQNQSPKALIVLLTGGNGDTGIVGDAATGEVTDAGNNFLVRSAQLFAERGFRVVTMDRPLLALPGPPAELVPEFTTNAEFDRYRVSPKHKHDIMKVVAEVNDKALRMFLVGTSRGTISAFAQNKLAEGIALSSPVTAPSGDNLYIGHPDYRSLQARSVKVPVQVLRHTLDACFVTLPQNAEALHTELLNAGVASALDSMSGGFDLTGQNIDGAIVGPCDSLTPHGFLGIENAAVDKIADWIDGILDTLKH